MIYNYYGASQLMKILFLSLFKVDFMGIIALLCPRVYCPLGLWRNTIAHYHPDMVSVPYVATSKGDASQEDHSG